MSDKIRDAGDKVKDAVKVDDATKLLMLELGLKALDLIMPKKDYEGLIREILICLTEEDCKAIKLCVVEAIKRFESVKSQLSLIEALKGVKEEPKT